MAFDINSFNNWSSGAAKGAKSWSYSSSTDTLATILADDYFLAVNGGLSADDLIYVVASDGKGNFYVASSSSTTVTLGATDGITVSRVTLSAAEVLLLATTPIELVAAPGAGKILMFDACQIQLDYNVTAYTEAGDNLAVAYTDASGVEVSQAIEMTGFITLTADASTRGRAKNNPIVLNSGCENQALVLKNSGSNFAGGGDSPLVVDTFYRIVNGV